MQISRSELLNYQKKLGMDNSNNQNKLNNQYSAVKQVYFSDQSNFTKYNNNPIGSVSSLLNIKFVENDDVLGKLLNDIKTIIEPEKKFETFVNLYENLKMANRFEDAARVVEAVPNRVFQLTLYQDLVETVRDHKNKDTIINPIQKSHNYLQFGLASPNEMFSGAQSSSFNNIESYNVGGLKISKDAVDFLKDAEGSRNKVYKDSVGKDTIGIGHLIKPSERNKFKGKTLSDQEVIDLFLKDLEKHIKPIEDLPQHIKDQLNPHQVGALASLAFNIGTSGFKKSSLYKHLKNGDFNAAADSFTKYNRAGNKVNQGLKKRRNAEKILFLTGIQVNPYDKKEIAMVAQQNNISVTV